ncbi:hypothetical protein LCM20_16715 [Halobacillus litoralis]|uniref:hypothetical protein n=1 Tax=Halobacillus litoralis TaxID=45668 RepID=UPI001CD64482|nr:hypothetical protein [Halobacillus litoralis]MCA0972253.1 hypothetical protein [Halobacillus litoralis]
MSLRDMTLDELMDEEERLQELIEVDGYGYSSLISVYEAMIKRYRKEKEREAVAFVQRKVVKNLVNYGAYLKMGDVKRTRDAIDSLKKAISLHNCLPIAHYRLGFLYSRHQEYAASSSHFEKAIQLQDIAEEAYRLDERQLYYAHLYAINSSLHQAYEIYKKMDLLGLEGRYDPLGFEGLSDLYGRLLESDNYLEARAFVKVTNDGEGYCSKKECEAIVESPDPSQVILFFNDREIELFHGYRSTNLTYTQADVLRDLVLHSAKEPFDGWRLSKIRGRVDRSPINTVAQTISRLRRQLAEVGLDEAIQYKNQKYVFEPSYVYTVLYRHDDRASIQ